MTCEDGTAYSSDVECSGGDELCRGRSACMFCNGDQTMDLDPIRRACYDDPANDLREDVCEVDGTAGLLLPVVVPETSYVRNLDPNSGRTRECRPGKFFWKEADLSEGKFCPDGSRPRFGRCLIPHSGSCEDDATFCGLDSDCTGVGTGVCVFRAGCINGPENASILTPAYCRDGTTPCTSNRGCANIGDGICRVNDARSFNRMLRDGDPYVDYMTGGQPVLDQSGRAVTNAFYRSHEVHTATATVGVCARNTSGDQIDCLVQASGCSTGFARRGAPHLTGTSELDLCPNAVYSQ